MYKHCSYEYHFIHSFIRWRSIKHSIRRSVKASFAFAFSIQGPQALSSTTNKKHLCFMKKLTYKTNLVKKASWTITPNNLQKKISNKTLTMRANLLKRWTEIVFSHWSGSARKYRESRSSLHRNAGFHYGGAKIDKAICQRPRWPANTVKIPL